MKAVLISDKTEDVKDISGYLAEICSDKGIEILTTAAKQINKEIESNIYNYDVAILNIYKLADGLSGLKLGKAINEKYPHCQIICCVEEYDCIPDVYEVEHCFLFRKKDFKKWADKAVDKAVNKCRENGEKHYIEFMYERRPVVISQSSIKYIERERRIVNVHTDTKKYQIYVSIREFASQLDYNFVRCQGGFIVNLEYIDSINSSGIHMKSGEVIPVGKTYRDSFKTAYKDYIKRQNI